MGRNNVVKYLTEDDVRVCANRMARTIAECSEISVGTALHKSVASLVGKINSYRKVVRSVRNHLRFGTLQMDVRLHKMCVEWLELCDRWDDIKDEYITKDSTAEVWEYANLRLQ